jgi:hypothetical protein
MFWTANHWPEYGLSLVLVKYSREGTATVGVDGYSSPYVDRPRDRKLWTKDQQQCKEDATEPVYVPSSSAGTIATTEDAHLLLPAGMDVSTRRRTAKVKVSTRLVLTQHPERVKGLCLRSRVYRHNGFDLLDRRRNRSII